MASSLAKAALIRIDDLLDMAISGSPVPRWEGGDAEASCTFELLALRNAAALARNFAAAGYDAVIEGVLEQPHELDSLLDESGTREAYFISLLPARDALEPRDQDRPPGRQMGERSLELHEIFGFNGTTEWALASIDKDKAVWLPRETQLRELLADSFRGLVRTDHGWQVRTELNGQMHTSQDRDAEQAYGLALLHLLDTPR